MTLAIPEENDLELIGEGSKGVTLCPILQDWGTREGAAKVPRTYWTGNKFLDLKERKKGNPIKWVPGEEID